ncbi:MAG: serine hydrolase [Candidatus Latescibacterota bacterium]|nr:serine hydrolase [Candidatus Latescibacterota bacterium]
MGLVEELVHRHGGVALQVLEQARAHELQILYTQIDRDAENFPYFTRHEYRYAEGEPYFYPASTVKMAGAFLALERLNELDVPGLDRHTHVRIDSAAPGQVAVLHDSSSPTGLPSIGHYIHKLFVVSDNDAYNRLYEFLGQKRLNRALWDKGYADVRLTHRLSASLSAEQDRCTNPVTFLGPGREVLFEQGLVCSDETPAPKTPIRKGGGYQQGGELVEEPMDFTGKNWMSLTVMQEMLQAVLFPEAVLENRRFGLSVDDYDFLFRSMSLLPRESRHPCYDPEHYYDGYVKFALFGDTRDRIPEHIRVFNKVGFAYGYLTENAYVVDFDAGVEFLLTAALLVNANGVFNDGEYEYDEIGFPFVAELGRTLYKHELVRKRVRAPDLSRFTRHRRRD